MNGFNQSAKVGLAIRLPIMLTIFMLMVSIGCVRRRLTIRTKPAGAMAYVDKKPIGTTPISVPFTYYGTREIEVVADGFRTEKVLRQISPPWYQVPPLDFASEVLWPREIRDERVIDITLVPAEIPPTEVLQARADDLRLQASQGIATPIPTTIPMGGETPGVYPATPSAVFPRATGNEIPSPVLPNRIEFPQRIPEVGGSYRVPVESRGN